MKSAFVTGATGFVGLNLVEELVRQGWQVTALHRANSDLAELGRFPVTLMPGDITDPGSLRAAMAEDMDVVFHVAGNTNLWSRRNAQQTAENVEGTRNVVETALARGAKKLVLTSSIAAYGEQTGELTEARKSRAKRSWINYQRTKWLAETATFPAAGRGCSIWWPRIVCRARFPAKSPPRMSAKSSRRISRRRSAARSVRI